VQIKKKTFSEFFLLFDIIFFIFLLSVNDGVYGAIIFIILAKTRGRERTIFDLVEKVQTNQIKHKNAFKRS